MRSQKKKMTDETATALDQFLLEVFTRQLLGEHYRPNPTLKTNKKRSISKRNLKL